MEIEPKSRSQIAFEIRAKQEYKLLANIRFIKGLTLFSYNYVTDEIKKVEVKHKVSIGYDGREKREQVVQFEEDTIYVQSLNMKKATRACSLKMLELYNIDDHKDLLAHHKSEKLKRCKPKII